MRPETALLLADLHVAGAYGMMPEKYVLANGSDYKLNRGQRYLLECLAHILANVPRRFDYLILNGDVVEGPNEKEGGLGLAEVDVNGQARAALRLLQPFADRAGDVYMTVGSKYHVGVAGQQEEVLGMILGACPNSAGRSCHDWLHLWMGGNLLDIAHAQSQTIRYRSMPLERELDFASQRAGKIGEDMPAAIIRSHAHWGFGLWREGNLVAVSTPPMKLQDRYAETHKMRERWRPFHLGAIFIRSYPDEVDGYRVHIRPFLFDHPPKESYGHRPA